MITFDKEKCQGCSLCIEVCPKKILTIDNTRVNGRGHSPVTITDEKSCIMCALCAMMCPDCVIEVSKEVKDGK
jgi:2-oxoglutarate ferredoxin oxidoreductase subunit delta